MPYKYIEGLTTADVCFEATGKNLEEMFECSAQALLDIIVDTKTVEKKIEKNFTLEKDNLEELLFNFLDEILFYKDSENLIFNSCKINSIDGKKLEATLFGDEINHEKQELKVDVKAITMHKFEVKKEKDNYIARVIVDI